MQPRTPVGLGMGNEALGSLPLGLIELYVYRSDYSDTLSSQKCTNEAHLKQNKASQIAVSRSLELSWIFKNV